MRNITSFAFFSAVLAIFTGFVMGKISPFYGLAIVGFLVFMSLTIANIRYGIIFWILTGGVFVPPIYTVRNAGMYPSTLMLPILFLFWIIIGLDTKKLFITQTKLFWPLILLIIITLLSAFKGGFLYDPNVLGEHRYVLVQIFASLLIIVSVFTVFLIPVFFEMVEQIRSIYFAFIYLGLGILVLEVTGLSRFVFLPSWAPFMQASAISMAYAGLLFMSDLSLSKKIMFLSLIVFSIQYILSQFFGSNGGQWISGWIVLAVPLVFITFCRSKQWGVFFTVLCFVLMFTLFGSQIKNVFSKAEAERDYDRFIMWMTALNVWLKNPVFGIGPGNYMDYSLTYAEEGYAYTSAHSQYFQILTELGGIGIICFFWLIARVFLLGNYLMKKAKDNFLKVFVIGIMGSIYGQLLASCMGDYMLPAYHNGGSKNICTTIYFWILIGILIAIEQIVVKEDQQVQGSRV